MIEVDYESFKFTNNFSIGMHRHFGAGNLWIILKDGILVGYFIFNRFIINCAVLITKHLNLLSEYWSDILSVGSFFLCDVIMSAFLFVRKSFFWA